MSNALKPRLMSRIPYNEDIHKNMSNYQIIIDDLIETSKFMALSLRYPYMEDYTNVNVPTKYTNWQYRCCIELYKLAGKEGLTSYSENGLNWSRLTDGLPRSLMEEIIPRVGIPKADKEDISNV